MLVGYIFPNSLSFNIPPLFNGDESFHLEAMTNRVGMIEKKIKSKFLF